MCNAILHVRAVSFVPGSDVGRAARSSSRAGNLARQMPQIELGLLTGVSYQSGLDYYKNINERYMKLVPKGKLMPPNPLLLMVSVDCDGLSGLRTQRCWR